jgi:hypothetical protein
MQLLTVKQKRLRLIIIILNILALISVFTISIAVLAVSSKLPVPPYLLLYIILFISTILIIAKAKTGFLLTLVVAILFGLFLMGKVSEELFFYKPGNYSIYNVLIVPLVLFLTLIPLTIKYLVHAYDLPKYLLYISIIFVLLFPSYILFDHLNKDYPYSVMAHVRFEKDGTMKITCTPGPGTEEFYITSNSDELAEAVKTTAESYAGIYIISDLAIIKTFRFNTFHSLTIEEVNGKRLSNAVTIRAQAIQGETPQF